MRTWSATKAIGLIAVANFLLALMLFSCRSPVSVIQDEGPPPELPQALQRLQVQVEKGSSGEPFVLELTETELSAAAGYFLSSQPKVPFGKVRITVLDGTVVLDGVTRGMAVSLPVRVTAAAGASDGAPWARVQNVSLGDTNVPAFVRDQVIQQANSGLDFSKYDLPVSVDTVQLAPGSMTVKGTLK